MSAWIVIAALSALSAIVLAAADGALIAAGHGPSRTVLHDPERAHRALALGRVLAHLLTGTAIALSVAHLELTLAVSLGVSALLILANVALVEGYARAKGDTRGLAMVHRLAPFIATADIIMVPVTAASASLEKALTLALPPVDDTTAEREAGAEQFREVVAAEADVTAAEEEILHGVFSLRDTQVQEIMVPRVDVVGIEKTTPWSELLDRVRSSEHARFPVFDDTLDNVLGVIYSKDLLPTVVADREPDDWTSLVKPAAFIPGTKLIDQQLKDFKAQHTHIALVIDEYGGMAGIVTIEDILEEIVGEIRDEYDVEDPAVEQEGKERFWVAGRVSIADLTELLSHDFQREDLTTVGGLVYDAFGRVPRAGESATIDGFRVVVERVRRRRIERVYIERIVPPIQTEETEQ